MTLSSRKFMLLLDSVSIQNPWTISPNVWAPHNNRFTSVVSTMHCGSWIARPVAKSWGVNHHNISFLRSRGNLTRWKFFCGIVFWKDIRNFYSGRAWNLAHCSTSWQDIIIPISCSRAITRAIHQWAWGVLRPFASCGVGLLLYLSSLSDDSLWVMMVEMWHREVLGQIDGWWQTASVHVTHRSIISSSFLICG